MREEGSLKAPFTKKKNFRRLISLADHKASTLQVTEKEKIAQPLSATSDS